MRPNCEHTLPVLLSVDEVQRILGCLRLPRYRVCLSTIYTCGLRLQEWLAALGRALPAGRQWLQRLKYLAPYIFRVAISNRRILRVENGQTVTPAGESPRPASDPPQSRSPRAGWRFTYADGLPLAQSAARFPKRCFALIPEWEYNSVTGQYDRLSSTGIMRRRRAA